MTVLGPVVATFAGGYQIKALSGCPSVGYLNVHVSSSTAISGLAPATGEFAQATGTGSCGAAGISATQLISWHIVTVSGSITGKSSSAITVKTGSSCGGGGNLNVYIKPYTAISGTISVGSQVSAVGFGSCTSSVVAMAISNGSSSSSSGSAAPHVLTADYLGGTYGTHSISWSSAAPDLTWAFTTIADSTGIHAAGIKTMDYIDPDRTSVGTPLYTSDSSTFALSCTGARVYDTWDSVTEWVMNPASASMRAIFAAYVASVALHGKFDAVFEDTAGPLSAYAGSDPFSPGYPCGYSDSSWINDEIGLNQSSPLPVIFNGLSKFNDEAPSMSLGLLAGSNTVGGNLEGCYSTTSQPKLWSWIWRADENTELDVAAKNKLFICLAENRAAASSETDQRLYAYASFLLTYDPSTSVYWSEFATTTGLHVMPETGLVTLDPVVSAPANVSSLEQSGGTYARQYGKCYYKGSYVGPCAVVVNSDYSLSHPFPYSQYHHTMTLSGSGVLDGGSVSFSGPAPPSTLPPLEARIVFP